jgi:TolB protein
MSQILLIQVSGIANLCLASSSQPDKLVPIADAAEGFAWTPEGGLVYSSPTAGNRDIWALSADKMTPKQLTVEDSIDFDPAVSPDGRYVVFVSDRAGKFNLWRINSDGSNPVVLTTGVGEQQPAFTPNGAFVLFSSMKDVSLWKVPIDGGPPTVISEKPAYQVSVSPDGTSFAHFSKVDGVTNILIRSLENGEVVQQFDTIRGFFVGRSIVWSKDGKSVFYAAHDSNSVGNIWRQPLDGKPPEKITNYTSGEIFHFDFSPDNSELALVRGGWKYDAVLMKGFKQ